MRRLPDKGPIGLPANEWSKNTKPFVWTKTADEILDTSPPTAA